MAQSWRAASVRSGPAPAGGEGIATSRDPRTARSKWSNYCHEICTRHKLIAPGVTSRTTPAAYRSLPAFGWQCLELLGFVAADRVAGPRQSHVR